jgi:aminoglycoside phosphotransferase
VWRVTSDTVSYLKVGPAGGRDGIVAERDRLAWLDGRQSTPRAQAHVVDGETGWLLTTEVPGVPAHDPRFRMGSVQPWLEGLGRSLRRFHDDLAVDSCPFDARLDVLLGAAERRVAAGGVDPTTLGSAYRRHSAEDLLRHLLAMRPAEAEEDLVVAHGDPCLPNFLMSPTGDQVSGLVDVGRLGVSDRYRDVAIIVRSLGQTIGPEVTYVLLDAYGIPHPDLSRLEFYVLLDEMW